MHNKLKTFAVLTCCYGGVVGCTSEVGDEPSASVRQPIEVGDNDVSNPVRNAVVRWGGCTGTLVAPDILISAHHCLDDDIPYTGGWTAIEPVWVRFGPDISNFLPFAARVIEVGTPPLGQDMVLLRLDRDVPASVAVPRPVYLDRPAPLQAGSSQEYTIFQIGYGGGRDRRIMTGHDYFDWLSPGSDKPVNGFVYVADELGVGTRDTNIEGGDSGGPMTLNRPEGPVMGVLSHWDPYGISTYGPGSADRPNLRQWLRDQLPPQRPDLAVVSIRAKGCYETDPRIVVTIRNQGAVTSRGWVDVFTGLPIAPSIGEYSSVYRMSDWLAPDQEQTLEFPRPDDFARGWVDVLLDTTRSVAELDETNNHEDESLYWWSCTQQIDLPDDDNEFTPIIFPF